MFGVTVIVAKADPLSPPLSLTDAVIVCTPIDSVRVNEGPLPMTPSRLDVHCTADERSPSCASLAEPVNVMALLTRNDAPDAGDEIDTTGSGHRDDVDVLILQTPHDAGTGRSGIAQDSDLHVVSVPFRSTPNRALQIPWKAAHTADIRNPTR